MTNTMHKDRLTSWEVVAIEQALRRGIAQGEIDHASGEGLLRKLDRCSRVEIHRLVTPRIRARRRIEEQLEWMDAHGGDRAGYVERYGDPDRVGCYGNGGTAIWEADRLELERLESVLGGIEATGGTHRL